MTIDGVAIPLRRTAAMGDTYADVETVRVLADWSPGPGSLLEEVWQRYGRPVAITEAHLGSTPNEQVRWLSQVWQEANRLKESGVDIRAVTIWSSLAHGTGTVW